MRLGLLLTGFTALAFCQTANAKEALKLEPSSVWAMNYAEDSCRLIRLFGEGENEVRLELRQFWTQGGLWALVSGQVLPKPRRGIEAISYRFMPDTDDNSLQSFRGELDDGSPSAMFPVSFAPFAEQRQREEAFKKDPEAALPGWNADDELERQAKVDKLALVLRDQRVILELGSMASPMKAMRSCLVDLVKSWGAENASRSPEPKGNPGNWLSPNDYPRKMLREGFVDKVDFRLMVDEQGKVTDCAVLTMESRAEFIDATCDNLMKNASFDPARDENGNAVAGVYINSVAWIIP